METTARAPPQIVALSSNVGFLHLLQTLFDALDLPVRSSTDGQGAPRLIQRLRPKLVVLDLVPGHETSCWLLLEALKAHSRTAEIPVLLGPVADWLLDGHESRLVRHGVRTWNANFERDDLLRAAEASIAGHRQPIRATSE